MLISHAPPTNASLFWFYYSTYLNLKFLNFTVVLKFLNFTANSSFKILRYCSLFFSRERREVDAAREKDRFKMEKAERERREREEKDRLEREEKERQKHQVTRHFEESLRLAEQKVNMVVKVVPFSYKLVVKLVSFSNCL